MTPLSRLALGATCAALPFTGTSLAPAMADSFAQPSCYGSSCLDLNPADTVCANDAVTLYETEAVSPLGGSWGVLEMRYSAACHSNWVRFTPWASWRSMMFLKSPEVGGDPWIWREGVDDYPRGLAGESSPENPEVSYWTYMVDASGSTCMSVDVYEFGSGRVGGFTDTDMPTYSDGWDTQDGSYTAGCFS